MTCIVERSACNPLPVFVRQNEDFLLNEEGVYMLNARAVSRDVNFAERLVKSDSAGFRMSSSVLGSFKVTLSCCNALSKYFRPKSGVSGAQCVKLTCVNEMLRM